MEQRENRFYRTKRDALIYEAKLRVVEAAREWDSTGGRNLLAVLRQAVRDLEQLERSEP